MTTQNCSDEKIIIITRGEKAVFDIYVKTLGRPFDLTNFNQFKLGLEKEDGSTLTITHTANANGSQIVKVSPDVLGHLQVTLGSVDTALLKVAFGQDMDLELNHTTPNPKRRRLHKSLNVENSLL